MVSYPWTTRPTTRLYWIEQVPTDTEACFLVVFASPLEPGLPVDDLVLDIYEEVEGLLTSDLHIVRNRASFGVYDHRYRVTQPTVEFLAPDAWATIVAFILLGLWNVVQPSFAAGFANLHEVTLGKIDSVFWGLLGNALYGFLVVGVSYVIRRGQARKAREVVFRNDE